MTNFAAAVGMTRISPVQKRNNQVEGEGAGGASISLATF